MSFKLFKSLLDKIVYETGQYDTLAFPGMGEPMLDKTLEKKIEYAKKRKVKDVLLLSNGSLLTKERFKRLENLGVTSIRISLYGNESGSYSKVHGIKNADFFDRVRNNLAEISKIKKHTQLLLTFNIVDGANEGCIKDWIDFWKGKVDLIEVWRPHNWVNAKNFRELQRKKLKTCGRPFRGPLQVQVDGTVNMCCFDFDGKLTLGDLKTQPLKEIFVSPLYKKLLQCHKTGNFKGSGLICENCDQRNEDKSNVAVYNSRFNIEERVNMISTTYKKIM